MGGLTSKDIVEATVAALTGKTIAEDRVYPWRTTPIQNEELPCLCVYAFDVDEQGRSMTDPIYQVDSVIKVQIHTTGSGDGQISEEMDTLLNRSKRALVALTSWWEQFRQVGKISTAIGHSVEGESRRMVANLEITGTHDYEYEPLTDEEISLDKVHYTDTSLEVEMEADVAD